MPTFKPDKLKTNLRLSINRFKLLEKKKSESPPVHLSLHCLLTCQLVEGVHECLLQTHVKVYDVEPSASDVLALCHAVYPLVAEQAMKSRKEIAEYIKADRVERARIRVEHIIREDYLVEAMEVLETYCDLLLARFGLLQTMQ